jgi:hypothetical protein
MRDLGRARNTDLGQNPGNSVLAITLRPGGRFAVSDVIADADMDDATRADMRQWTGCIGGALTREEF